LISYAADGPSLSADSIVRQYSQGWTGLHQQDFSVDECHTVEISPLKYTLVYMKDRKTATAMNRLMANYAAVHKVAVQESIGFSNKVKRSGLAEHQAFIAMAAMHQGEAEGEGRTPFSSWIERPDLRGGGMIASYCSKLGRGASASAGVAAPSRRMVIEDDSLAAVGSGGDDHHYGAVEEADDNASEISAEEETIDESQQQQLLHEGLESLQIENQWLRLELQDTSNRLSNVTGEELLARVGEDMLAGVESPDTQPPPPPHSVYYYKDLAYKSAMERNAAEQCLDTAKGELGVALFKLDAAARDKVKLTSSVVARVREVMEARNVFKSQLRTAQEELAAKTTECYALRESLAAVTAERDEYGERSEQMTVVAISDAQMTIETIRLLKERVGLLEEENAEHHRGANVPVEAVAALTLERDIALASLSAVTLERDTALASLNAITLERAAAASDSASVSAIIRERNAANAAVRRLTAASAAAADDLAAIVRQKDQMNRASEARVVVLERRLEEAEAAKRLSAAAAVAGAQQHHQKRPRGGGRGAGAGRGAQA
jgi:hypothetical protein